MIYLYRHETRSDALAVHILEMFVDRNNWFAWIGAGTQSLWIAAYAGVKVQNIRLLLQYHKSTGKTMKFEVDDDDLLVALQVLLYSLG